MKILILLVLCLAIVHCDKWAVLIAGSNTYSNYRHQADVFHAYQTLVSQGFDPDRIITFAYDDIANSSSNPFKGKVFNKPTYKNPGVDVYSGVKIDYTRTQVTPANFLAVLQGNKTVTKGKRVVQSTPNDNIFIFFSDHGAPGLIAFPSSYLYADQLIQTFNKMNGKYGKLVFYLQTCQSGSMFQKLPTNTKIYALSAANPTQSSWGVYCSPDDVISGKHIGSCLGDLFSVNFLQDIDKGATYAKTLNDQFQIVKKLTNLSHVMQWGDLSFQSDKVGDYVAGTPSNLQKMKIKIPFNRFDSIKTSGVMNSRTMKLQSLSAIYARQKSEQTFNMMAEQLKSMKYLDGIFQNFKKQLRLKDQYNPQIINFECLRHTIDYFENKCGKFSDYGLGYIRLLAESCESYKQVEILDKLIC